MTLGNNSIVSFCFLQDPFEIEWNEAVSSSTIEPRSEKICVGDMFDHDKKLINYLDWNSTQWRRRAWRKALNPSINKRTPMVSAAQKAKTTYIMIPPTIVPPPSVSPFLMTMFQRTSLNCAWAKLRAHNRRYEAVCDTLQEFIFA